MKDGWLKKVRARIANEIVSYICMGVFALILASMVILWQGFRTFLSTEYSFELPLWAWIIIGVVFSGLPLVMVLIKDRRGKLTDPNAIKSKLLWYLGQNRDYVANETYSDRPVVWKFAKIDKTIKLKRGSSKKFLPGILNSGECSFPVKVEDVSSENIRLKYDYPDYKDDPRVTSRQPSS